MIRGSLEVAAAFSQGRLWRGARVADANASYLAMWPGDDLIGRKEGNRGPHGRGRGCVERDRPLAGIGHSRRDLSHITGYQVDAAALPAAGLAIFMTRKAPVLAYEPGGGHARPVRPSISSGDTPDHRLHALLASQYAAPRLTAAATQRGLGCQCRRLSTRSVRRLLLVGDAAGSCHPLTASGISVAIGGRLRQALHDSGGRSRADASLCSPPARAARARRLLAAAARRMRPGGQARAIPGRSDRLLS